MTWLWSWYVIIGFISGIISGMGIGGGTVLIPALYILFSTNQQSAQNINLIYFIPTAAIAIITHKKNGNIENSVILKIMLYGLIGAAVGAFIAINIDSNVLRKIFGFFLLAMAFYEFCRKDSKKTN